MSEGGKVSINLLDSVPEADAIVSSGGTEQKIKLPAADKVLGGHRLRIGPDSLSSYDPLELGLLHQIYASANQTGFGKLTCKAY